MDVSRIFLRKMASCVFVYTKTTKLLRSRNFQLAKFDKSNLNFQKNGDDEKKKYLVECLPLLRV